MATAQPRRPQLGVGQRDRIVEEDHHPVAGEVLEGPLVSNHELACSGVILGKNVDELLRLGCLRKGRESAEVEVHDCDVGAMAGQDLPAVLARDELSDLGRNEAGELGALPLDRFEEPRVRDRDRGLVGERLGEGDVLVAEGALLAPVEDDDADQFVLDDDRNPKQRPVGSRAAVGRCIPDRPRRPGRGPAAA
jgi:hypothetical protein